MPIPANATREEVFHDLKHGKHHKDRTRAQEIAIAMKYRPGKRKKKKRKGSRK